MSPRLERRDDLCPVPGERLWLVWAGDVLLGAVASSGRYWVSGVTSPLRGSRWMKTEWHSTRRAAVERLAR